MSSNNYHHGNLKNALIKAGVEILAKQGVHGLSLRKVAKRAGVSHAAPYAHFADKQALIAAISTHGFKKLLAHLEAAIDPHPDDPQRRLVEGAWAYVQFAIAETGTFRLMFSDVLEKETEYPAFVEISQQAFERVVQIVAACQTAGVLPNTAPDMMAMVVWSQVHGMLSLLIEGQISPTLLEVYNPRKILLFALNQIMLVPFKDRENHQTVTHGDLSGLRSS